jgi:hypothetical protein
MTGRGSCSLDVAGVACWRFDDRLKSLTSGLIGSVQQNNDKLAGCHLGFSC